MFRFAVIALALAGAAPAHPPADAVDAVAFKIARRLDISAAHGLGVLAYGQIATAAVAVRDASGDIHVELPTLLAPIAGNIEAYLGRTAADTLR